MPIKYQYDFDLKQLGLFCAVAQTLHFRKAAEVMGIAQPALSRQIAQLESALGVMLFKRTRRKVELTPAGRLLFERLPPLLTSLERLKPELEALSAGQSGRVIIGFTGLAMATVLPACIRAFSSRYPGVRVELKESPTAAQIEALRAGEIDCGFFHPETETPAGIKTRQLLREQNGLVLPANHPLARKAKLKLQDMAETPFVLFPRHLNPGFYDRILTSCATAGITMRIVDEIWPRVNAIGLVRAGLGATFMTPSEARTLPAEVVFKPLTGPAPESRLVVGWSESNPLTPAVQAFIAMAAKDATSTASRR